MALVSKEVIVACPPDRLFDVIVDYARYPEFVPGITACRPRGAPGPGGHEVEYSLDVGLKKISYVLRHEEHRPRTVRWSLVRGDMMKVSSGSWELSPEGEGTRAVYSVEIQVAKPPLIPQAVVDRISDELTRVQLPRTLEAFKKRAERAEG
jgi:ribosome-associated toxin RatA of RatAB toxin-antitoxin module